MIDIRTKYSEEIARIVEANEANVKEAAESTLFVWPVST